MRTVLVTLTLFFSLSGFAESLTTIQVERMSCASCATAIENELRSFPEIDSVEISIKSGQVFLKYKEGKTLRPDQIRAAIQRAGYRVKGIENP